MINNPAFSPELTAMTGADYFGSIFKSFVGLTILAGVIILVFMIITGAISWISSGGNQAQIETARKRITQGVAGMITILSLFVIINLAGCILGVGFTSIEVSEFNIRFTGNSFCSQWVAGPPPGGPPGGGPPGGATVAPPTPTPGGGTPPTPTPATNGQIGGTMFVRLPGGGALPVLDETPIVKLGDNQGGTYDTRNVANNANYLYQNLATNRVYTVIGCAKYQGTYYFTQLTGRIPDDLNVNTVIYTPASPTGCPDFSLPAPSVTPTPIYYNNIIGIVNHTSADGLDPVPNATVELYNSSDSFVDSRVTDGRGFYAFLDISSGTYSVRTCTNYEGVDRYGSRTGIIVPSTLPVANIFTTPGTCPF